jgi:hypothetical protein
MNATRFKIPDSAYRELPPLVRKYFPTNSFSFGYLLTQNSAKTKKGEKHRYLTGVLYLAPHSVSGTNVCTSSSSECRTACLWGAGRLGLTAGRMATIARTLYLNHYPDRFRDRLFLEILKLQNRAEKIGYRVALRLNGTSDIPWESNQQEKVLQTILKQFPRIAVYDYTKHIGRCVNGYREKKGIANYHLTFSYNGQNWTACEKALADGCNVAVCFSGKLPRQFRGARVVEGDKHDLRFRDGRGVVVGLTYKLPKRTLHAGTIPFTETPNFVVQG